MARPNTILITWEGETHTTIEWEQITGIPRKTIQSRHYQGWPPEEMLTLPVGTKRPKQNTECCECDHWREMVGVDGSACHYALDTGLCRTAYKGAKIERCERKRAAMAAGERKEGTEHG